MAKFYVEARPQGRSEGSAIYCRGPFRSRARYQGANFRA